MNKSFVLVTQYFPPEIGGGSQRSVGFAEELAAQNDVDVTVITPFPTYLMKKEETKTRFKLYEKHTVGNYTVYETFVYASDRGSFIKRMMYYLSFTISATLVALLKIKKIDYLITISPPLFTGITGIILRKLRAKKFVFDIGDLWPESAVQLGFLTNKTAITLAEKLERYIYRTADVVNVVTKNTHEKLARIHPYIKKMLYIPNFVNSDVVKSKQKDSELCGKFGLDGKTVIGYAGNIGGAQGLKIVTDAAKLTLVNPAILYMIIGDGVDRGLLEDEIQKHNLSNVLLLPPVSRHDVVRYISLFDAMVIPLVKNELFTITIPSKLYESMAAEIPVLLCVDGEARRILEESECGYFIEPENPIMLAEKIQQFCAQYNSENLLGKNGRKRVLEEFDRKGVIKRFYNNVSE
ncbi:MAG: glycosyltransferase family 4 protein [Bacteroidota bacterium]